jgi:hypothetical protein
LFGRGLLVLEGGRCRLLLGRETDCAVELMACVPEWACPALNVECKEDEDCPGPPDSRCGVRGAMRVV